MTGDLLIKHCLLLDSTDEVAIDVVDGVVGRIGAALKVPVKKGVKTHAKGKGGGRAIDAEGRTVVPGFIDIHVQGAGGADVLDGTEGALNTISRTCSRFGVTGFLATTVFRPKGKNAHLAAVSGSMGRDLGGARLLGTHLEGPFISREKKGMILPECICAPSLPVMEEIERLAGGSLRIMTIAPELEGSLGIIRRLASAGVIASFGHSNATYEQTLKGIEAGISHVTHLFNAMPAIHHRSPGPLLAIFKTGGPTVQIIPDGVHLHPRMIKFAYEILGVERCITITDGMQAMGLPDGKYIYNGVEYESRAGAARYRDGTLIGTSLGMIDVVLRFMEFTGCSLEEAVQAASLNPARLLGLDGRKGTVGTGNDADLVVLDHDYSVWATIVGGNVVYQKGK